MHPKWEAYTTQSLAAAGFAVLDPAIAYASRFDLWSGVQDAAFNFCLSEIEYDLRKRGSIILCKADGIPVATRSLDSLTKRIEWQTGRKVAKIEVVETFMPSRPAPEMPTANAREKSSDLDDLRALALQDPPSHDCPTRRAILGAREQLAAMEVRA